MSNDHAHEPPAAAETSWWQRPGNLLLLALLVNGIALLLSHNYLDGDAHSRTYMALRWLEHPFFIYRPNDITWVFGPLHCYLNALVLWLWPSPALAPRLLAWLLTSLTIIPFFHSVRLSFGGRAAAIGTLLFCGYTLFIHPAAISVSEGINLLLLFTAIWGFLAWRERKQSRLLILAAVFSLLATSMRYESWLLAPFLTVAVLLSAKAGAEGWLPRLGRTLWFALISNAFAVMWIIGCWLEWRDPLFFMHYSGNLDAPVIAAKLEAGGLLKLMAYNLAFLPGVMLLSFPVTSFLAALAGLWQSLRKGPGRIYILLLLLFILFHIVVFVLSVQPYPLARFVTLPGAMLFAFVGYGVVWLQQRLKPTLARLVLPLLIVVSLLNVVGLSFFSHPAESIREKLRAISPLTNPSEYFIEAENYCEHILAEGHTLVVDVRNYHDRLLYLSLYRYRAQIEELWTDNEELASYIGSNSPEYILHTAYPRNNHELFEIEGDNALIAGQPYLAEQRFGIFTLYRKSN